MKNKATQVDVARAIGVSQRAVSAVLGATQTPGVRVGPATSRRIREAARKMGYAPCSYAQLLRGKRSGLIGVLMGDAEADVMYQRLALIDRLLRERGFRLMVGHLHAPADIEPYIGDFLGRRVEGVICLRHNFSGIRATRVTADWAQIGPVVFLDPPTGQPEACFVQPDRCSGIRQAIAHLAALGRSRPAIVLNGTVATIRATIPLRERLRGFDEGCAEAGLDRDRARVWIDPGLHDPDTAPARVARAVDDLVGHGGADAILAENDSLGMRLLKAVQARGLRIPADVAIIGYDNHPISRATTPEMTTIDHDTPKIAAALVDLLTARIERGVLPAAERRRIVTPALIVRGSTQNESDGQPTPSG